MCRITHTNIYWNGYRLYPQRNRQQMDPGNKRNILHARRIDQVNTRRSQTLNCKLMTANAQQSSVNYKPKASNSKLKDKRSVTETSTDN